MKKNKQFCALIILTIAILSISGFSAILAEPQNLSQDGIQIKVTKTANSIKGFQAFDVYAKNTTSQAKSVQMMIQLNDRNLKESAGKRGECTVFLKLSANGSTKQVKQCKETMPSNSWYATIIKVFGFIPDESSDSSKNDSVDSNSVDEQLKELDDMEKELNDME